MGIPWDFSCHFHVPIPTCHRCCAGASETAHLQLLPEEDYAWVTGVSLSGCAWECPPPQVDGQDPVVDVRVQKLSPLAVRQDRPCRGWSSAPELPVEQVETGIPPQTSAVFIQLLLLPCCIPYPLQVSPESTPPPPAKSHAHLSPALLSENSAQERSRGGM